LDVGFFLIAIYKKKIVLKLIWFGIWCRNSLHGLLHYYCDRCCFCIESQRGATKWVDNCLG